MSQWELFSNALRMRPLDPVVIKRFEQNQEPSNEKLKEVVESIDFVVPPAYEVWRPGFEWGARELILITEAISRVYFEDIIEEFQPDSYASFVPWNHVTHWIREYHTVGNRTKGTRDMFNTASITCSHVSSLTWQDMFNAFWLCAEYDISSVLCNEHYFKVVAPLSHSLSQDSPETEDFRELVLGHFLPSGEVQVAWQYRLARPWDWCLQTLIQKGTPPPEPVDVESAAAWLRHRFLYQGKLDCSEEAALIHQEKARRDSVDGEWPRLPDAMFNALVYDLVKKSHLEPLENPQEFVAADRTIVILPNQYYVKKFKETYGHAGADDFYFADRAPMRALGFLPPKSKIACFVTASALLHKHLYWDTLKKTKRVGRKWAFRRCANILGTSFILGGFLWCNYKLTERFAFANAGAVHRRNNNFEHAYKEVGKIPDRISVLNGWGPGSFSASEKRRAAKIEAWQQKKEAELLVGT